MWFRVRVCTAAPLFLCANIACTALTSVNVTLCSVTAEYNWRPPACLCTLASDTLRCVEMCRCSRTSPLPRYARKRAPCAPTRDVRLRSHSSNELTVLGPKLTGTNWFQSLLSSVKWSDTWSDEARCAYYEGAALASHQGLIRRHLTRLQGENEKQQDLLSTAMNDNLINASKGLLVWAKSFHPLQQSCIALVSKERGKKRQRKVPHTMPRAGCWSSINISCPEQLCNLQARQTRGCGDK